MTKLTSIDIEIAVARFLNVRVNLIVPNVSWGLEIHECDLLVVTKSRYLWEVEIKVSKADLVKDKLKTHCHKNSKLKRLYFAIPEFLESEIEHIPERAGIIIVNELGKCRTLRYPKENGTYKISEADYLKIAHLGCMRMWGLKRGLQAALSKKS